jgi:hypothetical protein
MKRLPLPVISPYRFLQVLFTIVLVVLLVFCLQTFTGVLNPDWFGYYNIFYDGGWLKAGDRDVGFLFLIKLYKAIADNNYDSFRSAIALYFTLFGLFFSLGLFIKPDTAKSAVFALFISICAFLFIRFIIQIREGIAATFLIYGFAFLLQKSSDRHATHSIFSYANLFAFIFFVLAYTIHSGTTLFLACLLLAFAFNLIENKSPELFLVVRYAVGLIITAGAITVPFFYQKFVDKNSFVAVILEESTNTQLSVGKMAYWLFYGLLIYLLRKKVLTLIQQISIARTTQLLLHLLTSLFLQCIYLSIIIAIIFQIPGSVIAAEIRLLNLIVSILLVLLAAKSSNTFFIFIFSSFILVDQIRTVLEALLLIGNNAG